MTDLDDYVPVAERITLFYERFPTGRIITRIVKRSADMVIVRASVYRSVVEGQPSATGLAAERPGDGAVNVFACLENAETSAIGRALANLGFQTRRYRPPPDDPYPRPDDSARQRGPVTLESLGVRTIYGQPVSRPVPRASPDVDVSTAREPPDDVGESRRPQSPVARDLVRLLDEGERLGLRSRRAGEWKARVQTGSYADAELERLEVTLRAWVGKTRDRRAMTGAEDD